MPDRSFVAQNRAELARLKALVADLSDDDLSRPLDHGWTVANTLGHLAFNDRRWAERIAEWERTGTVIGPNWTAEQLPLLNEGALLWIQMMSHDEIRREVVAAAEAIDHQIEAMSDPVLDQILAIRPRTVIRALHRRDHIADIERTIGRTIAAR